MAEHIVAQISYDYPDLRIKWDSKNKVVVVPNNTPDTTIKMMKYLLQKLDWKLNIVRRDIKQITKPFYIEGKRYAE